MKKQPYVIPETVLLTLQIRSRVLVEASGSTFTEVGEDDWDEE